MKVSGNWCQGQVLKSYSPWIRLLKVGPGEVEKPIKGGKIREPNGNFPLKMSRAPEKSLLSLCVDEVQRNNKLVCNFSKFMRFVDWEGGVGKKYDKVFYQVPHHALDLVDLKLVQWLFSKGAASWVTVSLEDRCDPVLFNLYFIEQMLWWGSDSICHQIMMFSHFSSLRSFLYYLIGC